MENSTNSTLQWPFDFDEDVENELEDNPQAFFTISNTVQALMYVMYIAITIAAVGGNSIVCYIVLAYQRMRTVTNFFIVNLAVGDVMMAVLCIPFTFVANLVTMYWPFGSIMCPLVTYAQAVSVFISAYTLVAISIDRYIAILYPLRPRMTKLQAKVIILLIWIVALVTPLPTAVLSRLIPLPNVTEYTCNEDWSTPEQRYYYSMALMILQYFFPLFVLIFTYARIAVVVWGKRAPGEAEDLRDQRLAASKRKMIKMMIACVTAFTLSWLPLNVLHVLGDEYPDIYKYSHIIYIWFLCHWLAMSHACLNPIIYWWMNSKFRAGFHYAFRCLPWMIRMMIIVVIMFTLCWLPMNTLIVVADQDASVWRYEHILYVWFVCHWLAMSHGCYNPIIYCWMNTRFRDGFLHVLARLHLRRKTDLNENGSLRRCNTFTSTYNSERMLSTRNNYRNGKRAGSRSARDFNEMQSFRKSSHGHMNPYDDDVSESHI